MLRRPIDLRWHIALGILPFLLGLAFYTWASWRMNADATAEAIAQARDAGETSPEVLAQIEAEGKPTILPTWGRIYKSWVDVTTSKATNKKDSAGQPIYKVQLWEDMKATFWRLFIGLLYSVLIALPLGVAMGCYAPVEAFFQPPLAFLAKIPVPVMYGVFLILPLINQDEPLYTLFTVPWTTWTVSLPFLDQKEAMYTSMILFGIVPNLSQTVYLAAKEDVPEEMLFKARTLGASQFSCIWDVILRQIMPRVLDGIRLAVGPALIFLYAAEMIQAQVGIGGMIRLSSKKGVPGAPEVYMYIVIAGLFGLLIDLAMRRLLRFMCPWYDSSSR